LLTHQIICVAVGVEGIPENARHDVNLVVKSGRESGKGKKKAYQGGGFCLLMLFVGSI
jgi:hypothetical protein